MTYSLRSYQIMVDDAVRMNAYARALKQVVTPGATVIDIGAGTGVLSLLACRFGAGRVYAIEPDDAIVVAKENAIANGFQDRIEFVQDLSTNFRPPVPADVIVSDLRGVLPPFQTHFSSIIHARENLLASGGQLIPQRDRLFLAVVELSPKSPPQNALWDAGHFELDLSASGKYFVHTTKKVQVKPAELLTESKAWFELDYATLHSHDCAATVEVKTNRDGIASGFVSWFDTCLLDDVGFSNAPGKAEAIYGQMYFPFERPLPIRCGDMFSIAVRAQSVSGDYQWHWNTSVCCGTTKLLKVQFRQSTFLGQPLPMKQLKKGADSYVPTLSEEGKVDRFILDCLDGRGSVGEIAQRVTETFPVRFANWREALERVAQMSTRYSN